MKLSVTPIDLNEVSSSLGAHGHLDGYDCWSKTRGICGALVKASKSSSPYLRTEDSNNKIFYTEWLHYLYIAHFCRSHRSSRLLLLIRIIRGVRQCSKVLHKLDDSVDGAVFLGHVVISSLVRICNNTTGRGVLLCQRFVLMKFVLMILSLR